MWNYLKTIVAERLNRLSGALLSHENVSMEEYQFWLDKNPIYHHDGSVERIKLYEKLNKDGTNDVFKALTWHESQVTGDVLTSKTPIVVKICKPYTPKGPDQHHKLNMILGAFYDEIRINNLVRATNIEGVVRSLGGGSAGRLTFLKMEYLNGRSLDNFFRTDLTEEDVLQRLAKLAYLANTISQIHYYDIIHKDLKPRNLILCEDVNHANNHKILVLDFGYANSKMRDTVIEYGGQLTPLYSAPEQAIMGTHVSRMVDYYSFGIIMHEYLTGKPLFPNALPYFIEDGYVITDRYLQHLKNGKEIALQGFPEVVDIINRLTIFDSTERQINCSNLYDIGLYLRKLVNLRGFSDVNTEFLSNQAQGYGHNLQ